MQDRLQALAKLGLSLSIPAILTSDALGKEVEPAPVVCWGDNSAGQSSVPPTLDNAVQVAAGVYHTLAIDSQGFVHCWGSCEPPPLVPGSIAQVAGGWLHSAALTHFGGVICWGGNAVGQCDVPISAGSVTQISAGFFHTAALRSDGVVVCWGYNGEGQCDPPYLWQRGAQVDAGGMHTVALLVDGTVVCWGRNDYGQCDVPADLSGVVQVVGGDDHSMALRADGTVVCWGRNDHGQCDVPAERGPFISIAGAAHSLALEKDGTAVCWGSPGVGCETPLELGPVAAVAMGCCHTVAIVDPPTDCDANGIDDDDEIFVQPLLDCDEDGMLDVCQHRVAVSTLITSPYGKNYSHNFSLHDLPRASGDVHLTASIASDLADEGEFVIVKLNGLSIGTLFETSGSDCPSEADVATLRIRETIFNHSVEQGLIQFGLVASPGVDAHQCPVSTAQSTLEYVREFVDCNRNSMSDACEISAGVTEDADLDGVPDECNYALGDFDLDGLVTGADLSILLDLWGTRSSIVDIDGSGVVDAADLSTLLGNWSSPA